MNKNGWTEEGMCEEWEGRREEGGRHEVEEEKEEANRRKEEAMLWAISTMWASNIGLINLHHRPTTTIIAISAPKLIFFGEHKMIYVFLY